MKLPSVTGGRGCRVRATTITATFDALGGGATHKLLVGSGKPPRGWHAGIMAHSDTSCGK